MSNRISGNGPVFGMNNSNLPKNTVEDSSYAAVVDASNHQPSFSQEQQQAIEQLEKAIRAVQGPEKTFKISIHQETHTIMVKVFDKDTGDLIREIPQEKLLDVAANMMELNGLIIDKKA
ncbi:flagellar protein FlaG [uncultured Paenibacillus sp.]|uniref:flagellar protein FlaG n=1 Tax=uncultured Paenibacillus sp. TaxID=227322 RepID=UPI002803F3E1|nr:flagellar protein FlaG [uncultured Paenibacillus sp.]